MEPAATPKNGLTYRLCKSALLELLVIYPGIARIGVDGVDEWLLSLAQPNEKAKLHKSLRLAYRNFFEVTKRPFMCSPVSVVFEPAGSSPLILLFREGETTRAILGNSGNGAVETKGTLDGRRREFDRAECYERQHTLAELQRVNAEFFDERTSD